MGTEVQERLADVTRSFALLEEHVYDGVDLRFRHDLEVSLPLRNGVVCRQPRSLVGYKSRTMTP